MHELYQTIAAGDLKAHTAAAFEMAENGPVVVMSKATPKVVMVAPDEWNKIAKQFEELENLRDIVAAYQADIDIWEGDDEVTDIDLEQLQAELDDAKVPA